MIVGLTITAVDPDEDYLGLEMHAANSRFAASTRIYAGVDELSELADKLEGFPKAYEDRRSHEFGTREPGFAGGFCSIALHCLDRAGHVSVEIVMEDDASRYAPAQAQFSFQTEAAAVDSFIGSLRVVEGERAGVASLPGS